MSKLPAQRNAKQQRKKIVKKIATKNKP